ncbi:hypothetical protein [Sulfuracidifex tepidarius]|uniref:Uncharacterized protein n=1 Tax=Sulfuracidifex tepidarius TaxID=1294262 RepID=A0A510E436_9CREN|nr:hypothetical protein [Sulfuracidifex tepidarius]BBG27282.1 hypothetical protein IC007_1827 [Sulfuracidifex tepidarius]
MQTIYEENEKMRLEVQRYKELVERLEKRVEKLERENRDLKEDREELRRIMRHYKKKYLSLRRIIMRTMKIAEEKEKMIKFSEVLMQLRETGEFKG